MREVVILAGSEERKVGEKKRGVYLCHKERRKAVFGIYEIMRGPGARYKSKEYLPHFHVLVKSI